MMDITFHKYQGTGNDFIIIDDREKKFDASQEQNIKRLCHRKFGIGADGLILIKNHPALDFEMRYFNADGKSSSFCGNGSRCAVAFVHRLATFNRRTTFKFMASDGLHEAHIKNRQVYLRMNDIAKVEKGKGYYYLDTGSPHYIKFENDVRVINVREAGRAIRNNAIYKVYGTNVNFVEKISDEHIFVRTYERGVEDETLSCGTGATAAAIAASFEQVTSPTTIETLGGKLSVEFKCQSANAFTNIFLAGPAAMVFKGVVTIAQ